MGVHLLGPVVLLALVHVLDPVLLEVGVHLLGPVVLLALVHVLGPVLLEVGVHLLGPVVLGDGVDREHLVLALLVHVLGHVPAERVRHRIQLATDMSDVSRILGNG